MKSVCSQGREIAAELMTDSLQAIFCAHSFRSSCPAVTIGLIDFMEGWFCLHCRFVL